MSSGFTGGAHLESGVDALLFDLGRVVIDVDMMRIHARWSANRRWRTARYPVTVVISQSSPSIVLATRWFGPYRVIGAITITHNAAGTVTPT